MKAEKITAKYQDGGDEWNDRSRAALEELDDLNRQFDAIVESTEMCEVCRKRKPPEEVVFGYCRECLETAFKERAARRARGVNTL